MELKERGMGRLKRAKGKKGKSRKRRADGKIVDIS
jgi:hypothetical protein